ncbi:MAG: nitronate monooxygenase [Chitinophagaceae bacterium]|nr:nitronate monooxygenase [Oligoflexus sp.]
MLQGLEAGGHRGMFRAEDDDPEIKAFDLLKRCVGKIKIPLIAAGGIMNSCDLRKALTMGADAVQMGTAFLLCEEAGTSVPYRQALLKEQKRVSKTTRVFSGRFARGIPNRFMKEMDAKGKDVILPFLAQNKFTRDLRAAGVSQGRSEFISLWCWSGEGELWQGRCAELIESLFE